MPNETEDQFKAELIFQLSRIGDALDQLVSHDNRLVQLSEIRHYEDPSDPFAEIDSTDAFDGLEVETELEDDGVTSIIT